mgnify:CR=1 FL=1
MAIFKKKSSSAIGIIGFDGATSASISSQAKTQNDRKQQDFLGFAATQITANYRPFHEIEEHLISKYKATPYILSEHELQVVKANVIMNRFREVLDLPAPLPKSPTRKQLLEYVQNDTTFEQARHYPMKKLGLVVKAYTIPSDKHNNAIVNLEMTTQYMSISNASKEDAGELLLWQGVSQDDIDNKTPRFVAYAYTLHELGRLNYAE